jgi:hypothetical protein
MPPSPQKHPPLKGRFDLSFIPQTLLFSLFSLENPPPQVTIDRTTPKPDNSFTNNPYQYYLFMPAQPSFYLRNPSTCTSIQETLFYINEFYTFLDSFPPIAPSSLPSFYTWILSVLFNQCNQFKQQISDQILFRESYPNSFRFKH